MFYSFRHLFLVANSEKQFMQDHKHEYKRSAVVYLYGALFYLAY